MAVRNQADGYNTERLTDTLKLRQMASYVKDIADATSYRWIARYDGVHSAAWWSIAAQLPESKKRIRPTLRDFETARMLYKLIMAGAAKNERLIEIAKNMMLARAELDRQIATLIDEMGRAK